MAGTSLLALIASAGAAYAADAASAENGPTVSEVIVTGTRQAGVKAVDSAAPIVVVGSQALTRVGQPDLIQSLSQNLPSFNAEGYGADTAALTLSAQLRGLNPNDTLVLVDGKRRHATANLHVDAGAFQGAATADLSHIPVSAIDHIEVLEDGAAAQYGSDAIAGVINIILKKADHGGSLSITGGQYFEGDGDTGAISLNKGFSLPDGKGFLNVTLEERYHDFSHQGGCDVRISNPDCSLKAAIRSDPIQNAISRAGVVNAANYPFVNRIYGDPHYVAFDSFYNAGVELGGGAEFYSFGSYGHRNASAYENYRLPSKVIIEGNSVANSVVPFPIGFEPREAIQEDDYSVTAGLKGAALGWNWDLSSTYGDNLARISTVDSANASLLNATGATPRNFFDGVFENSEWSTALDLSREFAVGLASPLNVAIGGETRRDVFTIKQGDAASIYAEGGQSYPGFQPTDAASHIRTNYSGYIDFAVDPVTGLKVDVAGRFEHYSDFGDTQIGKITARYDFNPMIAIRGTVSTGFRAPTLQEEYYSATNVSPSFAVVQLPSNSAAAKLVGFPNLKPEKSDSYSIGFVAHPAPRLALTVDAYEIDIHDRIVATGTIYGRGGATNSAAVLAAIAAHGNILDPGVTYVGISVFTNGVNTSTKGVEATASYSSDFGDFGHVDWSLGANYNETKITRIQATTAQISPQPLFNANATSLLTTATPKEKVVLGALWSLGKWSVNLRDTIYGPSSEQTSPNGGTYYKLSIPVTSITDLDISYAINSSLKLDVGANNLFDKKPPVVPYISGVGMVDGNNVYNEPMQFSPYGINGGYYYGKVTYSF